MAAKKIARSLAETRGVRVNAECVRDRVLHGCQEDALRIPSQVRPKHEVCASMFEAGRKIVAVALRVG